MARQPYFSGNYGSALAQIDTRPIMQGAAAQAAAYQGIGKTFAGEIEKYGLMKEKQKKQQGNIKSAVNFLDYAKTLDSDNAERYEVMKAQLNDPETPLTIRDELANKGIAQLTISQQMLERKGLMDATSANTDLTRQTKDLNDALSQFKVRDARTTSELNAANAELAKLKESISERVVFEQGGVEGVAKGQVGDIQRQKEALAQKITLATSQIAKIDRETELLGAPDPNAEEERKKLIAEAEKLGAEAAGLRDTQRRTNELLGGDSGVSSAPPPIREIVPDVAAGGDIKGWGLDAANAVLGFAFGATGFKDRRDEVTNIRAMNSQLMSALTKQISAAGSVYTQEDMKKILPQPGDDNPTMRSKLESLVPILKTKVAEAKVVFLNARAGKEKTNATRVIKTMPDLIKVLEASISQKNRRSDQEESERILGIQPR